MKQIILVRHGENDPGKKRLAGRLPGVVLNETGRQQAQQVAEWLSALTITAIFSSPIERALQTAQPLCQKKNLVVAINEGLTEIDYGTFQGKTYRQLRRNNLWKMLATQPTEVCFPGGETFAHAQERAVSAISEITENLQDDHTVVCFTHSDVIRLLLTHFLCMPLAQFQRLQINQGSLSIIILGEFGIQVPHINLVTPVFHPPRPAE